MEIQNPICGHTLSLLCHQTQDVNRWSPWAKGISHCDVVVEGILKDNTTPPSPMPINLKSVFTDCFCLLTVERTSSCGHHYQTECKSAFNSLSEGVKLTKCDVKIEKFQLNCGHFTSMKCWERDAYVQSPQFYKCFEKAVIKCWNFVNCQVEQESVCHAAGSAACTKVIWIIMPNANTVEAA